MRLKLHDNLRCHNWDSELVSDLRAFQLIISPARHLTVQMETLKLGWGEGGAGVVLSTSKLISIGAPETASNLGSYVLCGFSSVREVTALDLDLLHLLNDENNTFFSGTSEE